MDIISLYTYRCFLKSFKDSKVIVVSAYSFSDAESIVRSIVSNWENCDCYELYKIRLCGFSFIKI